MTFTASQERPASQRPQPQGEAATPAPHELKYRHDAAHYVADMLTELRQIAGKAGFEKLVASIDAAYYEAYAALGANATPGSAGVQEKTFPTMEPNNG
jgi:hypothetical protein